MSETTKKPFYYLHNTNRWKETSDRNNKKTTVKHVTYYTNYKKETSEETFKKGVTKIS